MIRKNKLSKQSRTQSWVVSLLVLAVFGFIGCETLDFSNPNSPDIANASIQQIVTGAESNMRRGLNRYLQVTEIIGRNTYFIEPSDPRFTTELLSGPIDAGGFLNNTPWTRRYEVVFNCNQLLERASGLSGAEQAGLEGYAKTIRAYQLLLMLNYLDTQGIRTNFDGDVTQPFVTKEEAFNFIENDLNEANTALGSAGGSFSFSISDGFSGFDTPAGFARFNRAIAARVAVYRGNFNDALTALGQSFLDPAGDLNLGIYHVYSSSAGDFLNPIFEIPTAAVINYYGHPSFETDAEAGDSRFSSKVVKRAPFINDDLTSDLGVTVAKSSTDPWPVIRNEELILLRAEANIGLGGLGAAEADINTIRAAAGLAPVTLTAANALDQLLYEKRYSLYGEGHRWIDLRRYGRLGDLPLDRTGDIVITNMVIPEDEKQEN